MFDHKTIIKSYAILLGDAVAAAIVRPAEDLEAAIEEYFNMLDGTASYITEEQKEEAKKLISTFFVDYRRFSSEIKNLDKKFGSISETDVSLN